MMINKKLILPGFLLMVIIVLLMLLAQADYVRAEPEELQSRCVMAVDLGSNNQLLRCTTEFNDGTEARCIVTWRAGIVATDCEFD